MEFLYFWILGWLIWAIGYYIYKLYISKTVILNKRLIIWRGFKSGIISWIGIIVMFSCVIVFCICKIDDWVEDKLS